MIKPTPTSALVHSQVEASSLLDKESSKIAMDNQQTSPSVAPEIKEEIKEENQSSREETKDNPGHLAPKEKKGLQEMLGHQVLKEKREKRGKREIKVILASVVAVIKKLFWSQQIITYCRMIST